MNKYTKFITILLIIIILIGTISSVLLPRILPINKTPPLNLVIISIDALRPDHMGTYGYFKDTTPNIDKWAKDAFVFTNAITTVPHTYPSFATLMTGKHVFNLGIKISELGQKPISDNMDTMATILKKSNYHTAAYVSNGFLQSDLTNMDKGFDVYQYLPYWTDKNENYTLIVKEAQNWIKTNKDSQFFLWIHFMDPHAPYEPSLNLRCKFNKSLCGDIENYNQIQQLEKRRQDYQLCQEEKPPEDVNEVLQTLYDGEITSSDLQAKKILDTLTETGRDKNTIVMIYGDHGEGFDHNYYYGHGGVLYDSSIKIPLLIKYPNIHPTQNKIDKLVENTDIMPTLMDMLNIKYNNKTIDGESFVNLLSNTELPDILLQKLFHRNDSKSAILMNIFSDKFAIYDGRYKYILNTNLLWSPMMYINKDYKACINNNQKEELYDIKEDPREENNILENQTTVAEKLKTELLFELSKKNLPFPDVKNKVNNNLTPTPSDKVNNNELLEKMKSLGY